MDIRDLDRLETRLTKESDRRFSDIDNKINRLETTLDRLEAKLENINTIREGEKTWKLRYILSLSGSFLIGGGALALLQFIVGSMKH